MPTRANSPERLDSGALTMKRAPLSRALFVAASLTSASLASAVLAPSVLAAQSSSTESDYDELVTLFSEWRAFEAPEFDGAVPDYTDEAMARQFAELSAWKQRLWSLDISEWPIEQQIDWHLVRAEMNGLDFDHRIRRPWAQNPAFYQMMHPAQSDVPAHEGPLMHGGIEVWTYDYPLSSADAAVLTEQFAAIPAVLEQARGNLAGSNARDIWHAGIRTFHRQANDLRSYRERVSGTSTALDQALAAAAEASDEFADWLEAELPGKTGPSGVGSEAYTWYMHNVHLVPWSWQEQVTIMRRELARSHASMRLEENRNRNLPELDRIATREQYDRELDATVERYIEFLEREEVETVEPWAAPALRAIIGPFTPAAPGEIRNFFSEVIYRDPLAFEPHMHHWIELARMREQPHASPIRSTPLLYNIFDHRSEGLATGVEEMFMHLGLLDNNSPRGRELIWIMLAQRAARATSGLMLHGGVFDMEEAVAFAGKWTPRGWLPDGDLVRGEQQLYLAQPGYGTSYVAGKVQIEELMAEVALQQGDAFTVKRFFDDFYAAGVIPTTLIRWQMTGEKDPILEVGPEPQQAPW
jgi:hypothetical protein